MDTDFFNKFLTRDDILKLSEMPENVIRDLKTLFESAPAPEESRLGKIGDSHAILHYHKAYTHIFIRGLDMASGDFHGCLVDRGGPRLCDANFRELIDLDFKFDFGWDPKTSFGAAMFYKIPEPEEPVECLEWFSCSSASYWRGMATLREASGSPDAEISWYWAQGWESMEKDDDIPIYVPDDMMTGDAWYFDFELKDSEIFRTVISVSPRGENMNLFIGRHVKNRKSDTQDYKSWHVCEISRKDFVSGDALVTHMPDILARIKSILAEAKSMTGNSS